MNIMTKRGSLDNNITYEHFCDTKADMVNINPNYITLGSVCIVINGEDDGMEVYMANSNKEWNSITMSAGSNEGSASSLMDLLDVKVLNPSDGQTLVYSAEEEKWLNHNSGGGSTGGPMVVHNTYDEETNVNTLDHTWQEINDALDSGKIVIIQDKVVNGDSFSQIMLQIIYKTTFSMENPESERYVCSGFDYEFVSEFNFYCPAANDYPSIRGEGADEG